MKPAPFEYFAPRSVAEAVALLGSYDGDAKLLAGGQSLLPLLPLRLAAPAAIVDLNRVGRLPGTLEVAFVRSPIAHGRVRRIDASVPAAPARWRTRRPFRPARSP